MEKYLVSDCPSVWTMHDWLIKATKLNTHLVKSSVKDVELSLNYDINKLQSSVLSILETYKPIGWQSKDYGISDYYTSISLRANENHQENLDETYSSIGSYKNNANEFFYNQTHNHKFLKNSYYDTYAFTKPTAPSQIGELGNFLSKIKRTIVRSRISTINGEGGVTPAFAGWHRDESIFINLRINVPITTSNDFYFEMEDRDPYNLSIGNIYSWDTNISHRVFVDKKTTNRRTHLVIGCSPWFDYNQDDQSWSPNKFFGKKHPFDMLMDGDILSNELIGS